MKHPTWSTLRNFVLLSIGLMLAACASSPPKPVVDFKADYNFSTIKKIAFYADSGQVSGENPLQLSDMQRDRIDEALRFALTNRGFQMVTDAAQADLLVSWALVTQQMIDVQSWGSPGVGIGGFYNGYNIYSGYNCWNCGTDITVRNYTQGTFIVDMIDPTLHKSVWRGVTESRLRGDQSEEQSRYNEAAMVIFASFPPAAGAIPQEDR